VDSTHLTQRRQQNGPWAHDSGAPFPDDRQEQNPCKKIKASRFARPFIYKILNLPK